MECGSINIGRNGGNNMTQYELFFSAEVMSIILLLVTVAFVFVNILVKSLSMCIISMLVAGAVLWPVQNITSTGMQLGFTVICFGLVFYNMMYMLGGVKRL